jgi:hypothetical protein
MKDYYVILQVSRSVDTHIDDDAGERVCRVGFEVVVGVRVRPSCMHTDTPLYITAHAAVVPPLSAPYLPPLSSSPTSHLATPIAHTSNEHIRLHTHRSTTPTNPTRPQTYRSATLNDIKAAYKNFALKLHPDVTGNNEVRVLIF